MSLDWYEILVQVAGILVAVIGGFGAVPAVNWLKGLLNLQGNAALILTVLFAVVWGVAEMVVAGQITPDSFTLSNLAALVVAVFAVSQAKYDMVKGND